MFYVHFIKIQHAAIIYKLQLSAKNITAALCIHPDKQQVHMLCTWND